MREFARVQRGDFSPAACVRCGRDTDLLDLGADDIRDFGRAYFCTNCFAELADKMEYIAPQELAAVKAVLGSQIRKVNEEKEAALRSVTALTAEANAAPAVVLERFAHDIATLVRGLPGLDRGPAAASLLVPAAIGAEEGGRAEFNAFAGGGTEDDIARAGGSSARGFVRASARTAAPAGASESGADGEAIGDGFKVNGAGAFDLDEWVASLGELDDEAPRFDGGNAGD